MTGWQIWIDRGGTFTDIIAKSPSGEIVTHKLLSENPQRYQDAAIQGICDIIGVDLPGQLGDANIDSIKMGTTVATNALLERKGDRTLLVITEGFGDALRIGYQNRPSLFARHIILPDMLYERVFEVSERLDVHGETVLPLDIAAARAGLRQAYDAGIRSVAIVLVHGYRFPAHEQKIAELAGEIGFPQISASHRVSPLIKLIARGDTTVVDAYLSPLLRRYIDGITATLGAIGENGPKLLFMQSNGGLTDANLFQGKDAILSGPAGGVVGMVKTGLAAGLQKLIGFDMGGTSTDVTHFAGEYERSFETMVAGVRMRAPMMHIHTVAAGGGSVLHFDGSRYRVGPDSAGANPGPACYGKGGPLTVTDCNVILGRIQPQYFPHVFGPGGRQPLAIAPVRKAFAGLASEIAGQTGLPRQSLEQVAAGFLRIAIENMANAIKKISVQRGYDVTEYTLNCFGGAGGQHACLVADALGIKKIFLHPLAGVLSAYGMGLADILAYRTLQVGQQLNDKTIASILDQLRKLSQEVEKELFGQGVAAANIRLMTQAHVRYQGSDSVLLIPLDDSRRMHEAFENAHRQRFGFITGGQDLVLEALSVEGCGSLEELENTASNKISTMSAPLPVDGVQMFADDRLRQAPVYLREALVPGSCITGPAIVVEQTSTIVVEPGWRAVVSNSRNLFMERYLVKPSRAAAGTTADPVMLEVFSNLFMSIAEQMGATLANTACSVNIKERLDFSCAIFDRDGHLVANAPHVPVHLGSMGESVKAVINRHGSVIRPGDVYILNAPYNGGTHLPDITVITPVFDPAGEEVLFFAGSRGHHADVGGRTPGSCPPDSRHIKEEGVLIEPQLLVRNGVLLEQQIRDLLGSGPYPCRNIAQNIADLTAQTGANATGARELRRIIAHFSFAAVSAYMRHVQDNGEESVRGVIDRLRDGEFAYRMDGGLTISVRLSVDARRRRATIDFTGTSPQNASNYNAPAAVCKAAVLYVFRTLIDDDIPLNEGCFKPLDIIIPAGCMLNPVYPAAVIAGNTEISQAITDALYGALGLLAASQGTMNNFIYGNEKYQNYETICGGTGAGPNHHGTSAVHSHMTNTRMTDPEIIESRFPVQIVSFHIRKNSGGKGRFNGGDGVVRKVRFLEAMTATILSSNRETGPYGLRGGLPGRRGENRVEHPDGRVTQLKGNDEIIVNPGDNIVIETPGGGGFGDPNQE